MRNTSCIHSLTPLLFCAVTCFAILPANSFGQTFTTLYSFGAVPRDGVAPSSGVVIDQNGNLFGVTGIGGIRNSDGTLFELSPPAAGSATWTETILHRFRGTPDGTDPLSRLVLTSTGTLYGTTSRGGANNLGTAYTLTTASGEAPSQDTVLHDFGSVPTDVVNPDLGFLAAREGLYGVDQGGANNTGAVYLLTPPTQGGSWTQHILYSFQPFQSGDGASPAGELVRDTNGNFYGVTGQGGLNNLGAVYEVSPPAVRGGPWTETVLFSFSGNDGTLPGGRLLLGANGQLFGTTSGGGVSGAGTVFEIDPPNVPGNPWIHKILYAFSGGSDGTSPESGVLASGTGSLLGNAGNTVFMLTPPRGAGGTWTETVLHNFSGPDGLVLTGTLAYFNHALYGTTAEGGSFGTGTVFQLLLP